MNTGRMRKRFFVLLFVFLCGCYRVDIPRDFVYQEIDAGGFLLASWQKITNSYGVFKIYIEGDGASFDAYGRATNDPTPKSRLVRELAFGDGSPNVVYLARPCQYVMKGICAKRHWTTARFAPEVINAEYEAVKRIVGNNEVILIGFSGGAQVAGLVAAAKPGLRVKKLITIGGNLDHLAWTEYHGLPALNESMNLADYKENYLEILQKHYVGEKDDVVPLELVYDFVNGGREGDSLVEVVKGTSHNNGFESIYEKVWNER